MGIDARIKMNALIQQNEELKQQDIESERNISKETRPPHTEMVPDEIQNEIIVASSNIENEVLDQAIGTIDGDTIDGTIIDERKIQKLKMKEQKAEEKAKLE